jgi:pimeloyl-ACP methyl ester carboxylesterase
MGSVDLIEQRIEVGGATRHVYLAGDGPVTVVFEPAIADVGLTWYLVQSEVAGFTSTVTHDRPGLGDSEPSERPRQAKVFADELYDLLSALGSNPPFLLVGHSFASLTVQLLAQRVESDLAGVVLLDGAHEDQMTRFPAELSPGPMLAAFAVQLRQMAADAREGNIIPALAQPPAAFPRDAAGAYRRATAPNAVRLDTAAAEFEGLEASQAVVRSLVASRTRLMGEIPLIVIRHGVAQPVPGVDDVVNRDYEDTWRLLQDELAARSSQGVVRVAEGSGHNIHHDTPGAVVEAIRDLAG